MFLNKFAILFTKFSYSVNKDFWVCFFAGLGVSNTVGSGACSGFGSGVGILSWFSVDIFCF